MAMLVTAIHALVTAVRLMRGKGPHITKGC